jgi:tetratricopeptide (TPR) repeat protein
MKQINQYISRWAWVLLLLIPFFGVSQQAREEQTLLKSYAREKNPKRKFNALVQLGNYYQLNNLVKADSLRAQIILTSASLDDSVRFAALIYDAELDKSNGNKELYYSKIVSLQPYLNKISFKKVRLEIYQRLGEFHQYSRAFTQADFYIYESLKLSKSLRDNQQTAESYILLANQQTHLNNKDSAMYFVNEALRYSRRSASKATMASSINCLATIYGYFGQVELSVSKNLVALQLAQESGDLPKVTQYSLDLGLAQFQILNYREAKLYFRQANEVANQIQSRRLIALSNIYLGMIFQVEKRYPDATAVLEEAISVLTRLNDVDGLGIAHNNLGNVYREKKEYPMALSNYNKALVFFESSGNREQTGTVYHSVGIVFEKLGKYKNALNYLNRSVEIRSQFGFKGTIYDVYKTISEVYNKTGNKRLAFQYLKQYTDYSDSAKTIESSAKIAELNELYRTEQREQLISSQAESIEQQRREKVLTSTQLENIQLKSNLQAYIILGFALVIILGGIILFYRWNQTKIKQQQREAEMNQTLLRAQMNPHFVFNAMSVIQSYIYENDIKNSSKFLVDFSKLMRLILENSSKEFIAMQMEVEILDKYLSIQKLRFEDRFEYDIQVDPILLEEEVVIPPMITQPFIENAIEHGQLHLKDDGFIHVQFRKKNGMLHIVVEDNGIGRKSSEKNKKSSAHKSMAMKITRERIKNLNKKYREEGDMKLEDYNQKEETGTRVLISIPLRSSTQNLV